MIWPCTLPVIAYIIIWALIHIGRAFQKDARFHVRGLPVIGSSATFALYGADLLAWASAIANDAFKISLLFESYIFLTSPEAIKAFTSAPASALSLEPAVSHFTQNCFGLSDKMWCNGQAVPAETLRQLLRPQQVEQLSERMAATLLNLSGQYFSAQHFDLAYTMPRWVMHATLEVLFGKKFLDIVPAAELMDVFTTFDDLFEVRLALSQPCKLFGEGQTSLRGTVTKADI
jgi:hypothetical protein